MNKASKFGTRQPSVDTWKCVFKSTRKLELLRHSIIRIILRSISSHLPSSPASKIIYFLIATHPAECQMEPGTARAVAQFYQAVRLRVIA